MLLAPAQPTTVTLPYNVFEAQVVANNVTSVTTTGNAITGTTKTPVPEPPANKPLIVDRQWTADGFGPPKSSTSYRDTPLQEVAVRALADHLGTHPALGAGRRRVPSEPEDA